MDSCWAFWNGYNDSFDVLSPGNGFKLGPSSKYVSDMIRTLTNCLSFENTANGFLCNNYGHPDGHDYMSTIIIRITSGDALCQQKIIVH